MLALAAESVCHSIDVLVSWYVVIPRLSIRRAYAIETGTHSMMRIIRRPIAIVFLMGSSPVRVGLSMFLHIGTPLAPAVPLG